MITASRQSSGWSTLHALPTLPTASAESEPSSRLTSTHPRLEPASARRECRIARAAAPTSSVAPPRAAAHRGPRASSSLIVPLVPAPTKAQSTAQTRSPLASPGAGPTGPVIPPLSISGSGSSSSGSSTSRPLSTASGESLWTEIGYGELPIPLDDPSPSQPPSTLRHRLLSSSVATSTVGGYDSPRSSATYFSHSPSDLSRVSTSTATFRGTRDSFALTVAGSDSPRQRTSSTPTLPTSSRQTQPVSLLKKLFTRPSPSSVASSQGSFVRVTSTTDSVLYPLAETETDRDSEEEDDDDDAEEPDTGSNSGSGSDTETETETEQTSSRGPIRKFQLVDPGFLPPLPRTDDETQRTPSPLPSATPPFKVVRPAAPRRPRGTTTQPPVPESQPSSGGPARSSRSTRAPPLKSPYQRPARLPSSGLSESHQALRRNPTQIAFPTSRSPSPSPPQSVYEPENVAPPPPPPPFRLFATDPIPLPPITPEPSLKPLATPRALSSRPVPALTVVVASPSSIHTPPLISHSATLPPHVSSATKKKKALSSSAQANANARLPSPPVRTNTTLIPSTSAFVSSSNRPSPIRSSTVSAATSRLSTAPSTASVGTWRGSITSVTSASSAASTLQGPADLSKTPTPTKHVPTPLDFGLLTKNASTIKTRPLTPPPTTVASSFNFSSPTSPFDSQNPEQIPFSNLNDLADEPLLLPNLTVTPMDIYAKPADTVDFGQEMDYSGFEWFKDVPPARTPANPPADLHTPNPAGHHPLHGNHGQHGNYTHPGQHFHGPGFHSPPAPPPPHAHDPNYIPSPQVIEQNEVFTYALASAPEVLYARWKQYGQLGVLGWCAEFAEMIDSLKQIGMEGNMFVQTRHQALRTCEDLLRLQMEVKMQIIVIYLSSQVARLRRFLDSSREWDDYPIPQFPLDYREYVS